jgi:hypothetical protein
MQTGMLFVKEMTWDNNLEETNLQDGTIVLYESRLKVNGSRLFILCTPKFLLRKSVYFLAIF